MINEIDDAEVLTRSLGDPAAFAVIYRRHMGPVLRYTRRRLGETSGEDAATEVFVRAFKQRGAYVAEHPTALPWLYLLAGRVIGDHIRVEERRLRILSRLESTAEARRASGSDQRSELAPEVIRGLRKLSDSDRETLLLVVWGELTYEEAAVAVGVPVGTVRSRIARARKQLRQEIPTFATGAHHPHPGEAHV
jgi:RNA polymerase sigma factor (sigma-70 family)